MLVAALLACAAHASAQTPQTPETPADSIGPWAEQSIDGVEITQRKLTTTRMKGAINGQQISRDELFKAACCNLGESFVTNPSVDVNYNDAATGARQIRLLGLSGTYVQMLSENLPDFRGAAAPYSLGYVPGPWMRSIQVSKGSASVRNGYESMTGQIDVEYLKPEDDQGAAINLFGSTESRFEANADANLHVAKGLSSEILAHYENRFGHHDNNGDGFQDMPNVRQVNLQNRWSYIGRKYMFRGGLSLINEHRMSGQTGHGATTSLPLYSIGVNTDRYSGYMKHAFVLNRERNTSLALMASATMHMLDAAYGGKSYGVNEKNAYAQLMFESDFGPMHNLALGVSFNHDYLGQHYRLVNDEAIAPTANREKENVVGGYAQYTLNAFDRRLTAMLGLRVDNSSRWGTFVTPRMHLKWQPIDLIALRLSAGKGYRTAHPLAESHYLLASSRRVIIASDLRQENAWNYGAAAALNIPLFGQTLLLNAEYYYTHFGSQVDYDLDSDPHAVTIANVEGRSYSHTLQVDATYPLFRGMTLTAAYRRNIVRSTYGGTRMDKPLTSRYKALISGSYKTRLGLWQVDATLQLNGSGRMPSPYATDADGTLSWAERYPAFAQLSAQATRWFRHFSVYVGGENLTNYRQRTPVYGAAEPWGDKFDATMVWGPVSGAVAYVGIRINIGERM